MKSTIVLETDDLAAGYNQRVIVEGIRLHIEAGEWCSLLGPNGSGKTTLLRALTGQIELRRGRVAICGHSLVHDKFAALLSTGVACPPSILPGLLTGRQCLQVYAAAKELETIDVEVLELASALEFTPYLDRYVDTYSLGTCQKLAVLLAMLGSPRLVILDEAFNGLDPASGLVLKEYLHERVVAGACSVLLATHAVDIAERYSDTAALLLDGSIVRSWNRPALQAMQSGRAESLETELIRAAEAARARDRAETGT